MFEYYRVQSIFETKRLPNLDIHTIERFFPKRIFTFLFFCHMVLWGLYSVIVARKETADQYYTRDSVIAFWLTRFGLPTIYEAHSVPRRAQRWLHHHIAGHPTLRLVVVITSFIKERFVAMGFSGNNVIVLPDAVDLSLFSNTLDRSACRSKLELPSNCPIIGYIGRFHTMNMEKGIPELVKAMKYLLDEFSENPPLLLCIGGPMERVPHYLEIAHENGVPHEHLCFVDRVPNDEVPFWMQACDVATIPWTWNEFSAYYTSPMKLFEYMASDTPIVASDLPSLREVLRHGENAWLVQPGGPHALAEGISTLLRDRFLSRRLAKQARQDVEQYTWERRARSILELAGN